jgi:hypothetical protein
MVPSGFKRFRHLSFINQFSKTFSEKVLKYNMINIKNKAEFKNLDNSEVLSRDFSGLRTPAASVTSSTSSTSMASLASKALFHQITS